ncbi:MAG: hypothetical protein WCC65_04285 [Pseudonocardiaceae bacterium]
MVVAGGQLNLQLDVLAVDPDPLGQLAQRRYHTGIRRDIRNALPAQQLAEADIQRRGDAVQASDRGCVSPAGSSVHRREDV